MVTTNSLLRRLAGGGLVPHDPVTDADLLGRFIDRRDGAAFAELLARHGPMVWGVCRRLLADHQDAEDAFQATFLVLARKARTVVPRDRVGAWLHGVARCAARKARADRLRRRAREREVPTMPDPPAPDPRPAADLAAWVDEELARLPEHYRAAVVACDLGGLTVAEAAARLGCPPGTVASRLSRGRALLARRLSRHGPAVGSAGVAVLAGPAAAGGPPSAAVRTTLNGVLDAAAIPARAASLTEGVLKMMLAKKLSGPALALAVVLTAGFGVAALADSPDPLPTRAPAFKLGSDPGREAGRPAADLDRLVGVWELTDGRVSAKGTVREFTPAERYGYRVSIHKDGTVEFAKGGLAGHKAFALTLDAARTPGRMTLYPIGENEDKSLVAVYRLRGRTLEIACHTTFDRDPPASLALTPTEPGVLLALEREEETPPAPPAKKEAAPADRPAPKAAKLPADPDKVLREWLAGTWQATAGHAAGRPLTAWERHAVLVGFNPDGTFSVHGGRVGDHWEYAVKVDPAGGELVLTPKDRPDGKKLRVTFAYSDTATLTLAWYRDGRDAKPPLALDPADRSVERLTLIRQGAYPDEALRPLGLRVDPAPENVTAARLPGLWRLDRKMTERLSGTDVPADEDVTARFTPDADVAKAVPAAYRDLLAGKRLYLAGRMEQRVRKRDAADRSCPFVLTEHEGNPVLLVFDGGPGDRAWLQDRAMVINVVPAANGKDDLLFLRPLDQCPRPEVTGFRRVAEKR